MKVEEHNAFIYSCQAINLSINQVSTKSIWQTHLWRSIRSTTFNKKQNEMYRDTDVAQSDLLCRQEDEEEHEGAEEKDLA